MSRIIYKLTELADEQEQEIIAKFVDKVENCGNDILEIHCDCNLNEKVSSLITELHCKDNNKSVVCMFKRNIEETERFLRKKNMLG